MTFAATVVFGVSLGLLIVLFILKRIEVARGARFAEGLRLRADHGALRVKYVLAVSEWYLENTPWFVSALTRYGVHVGALSFAKLARSLESQAHNLADLVSHKHRFERRETKSDFLKQVSERPAAKSESALQQSAPYPTQMTGDVKKGRGR